MYVVN